MASRGGKSKYSVTEVCEFLSRGMALTITVSKNEELNSVADLYLKNTTKTLNLLKNHLNADDFATQYVSVYKEHVMLLGKIRELQVVLEKKHKHAKIKRRAAIGLFVTAFVPFVAVSFLTIASPISGYNPNVGENLVKKLWELPDVLKDSEKSVEAQIDLSLLIENRTQVIISMMKNLVDSD